MSTQQQSTGLVSSRPSSAASAARNTSSGISGAAVVGGDRYMGKLSDIAAKVVAKAASGILSSMVSNLAAKSPNHLLTKAALIQEVIKQIPNSTKVRENAEGDVHTSRFYTGED